MLVPRRVSQNRFIFRPHRNENKHLWNHHQTKKICRNSFTSFCQRNFQIYIQIWCPFHDNDDNDDNDDDDDDDDDGDDDNDDNDCYYDWGWVPIVSSILILGLLFTFWSCLHTPEGKHRQCRDGRCSGEGRPRIGTSGGFGDPKQKLDVFHLSSGGKFQNTHLLSIFFMLIIRSMEWLSWFPEKKVGSVAKKSPNWQYISGIYCRLCITYHLLRKPETVIDKMMILGKLLSHPRKFNIYSPWKMVGKARRSFPGKANFSGAILLLHFGR